MVIDHSTSHTLRTHAAAPNGTYESWIIESMFRMFSSVEAHTVTRRPVLHAYGTMPFVFDLIDSNYDINPYIFSLNADEDNIDVTCDFILAMKESLEQSFPNAKTLKECLSIPSGTQIMTHFVTTYNLPTWHSLNCGERKERQKSHSFSKCFFEDVFQANRGVSPSTG